MYRLDKMWMLIVLVISVQTGTCDSCEPGEYWSNSHHRCVQCRWKCATCTSYNYCSSCKAGFYGYKCDNTCSNDCATCTLSTRYLCDTCNAGLFGYGCGLQCSHVCVNGQCDKHDGYCTCTEGYYQTFDPNEYDCARCPVQCTACTYSSECISCTAGYFGIVCDKTCLYCKNDTCVLEDGMCSNGCKDGYYEGTAGCKPCLGNCSICSSDSDCDECRPGYYGYMCQRRCPQNCYTCENDTVCLNCNTGYYGRSCGTKCPSLCRNGCRKEGGECDGCIDAYYEEDGQCKQCSNGCSTCLNIDKCFKCQDGFFLDQTTHHCRVCSLNCYVCSDKKVCKTCQQGFANVNGSCLSCQNCKDSRGCLSGDVCYQCHEGFWGSYCGRKCNDTCIRCGKSTGECTECNDNTFGPFCEQICSSNCLQSPGNNSTCWQHNGTCSGGCIQGFTGSGCIDELPSTTSPHIAMIVGSTSGIIVLVIVVFIVVIIICRRRFKQQDAKAKKGEPIGSREPRVTVLNLTYDDTDDEPKTVREHQYTHSDVSADLAEHVYAVLQEESLQNPAKPNKTHERKNAETDNVYDVTSGGNGQGMHSDSKMSQAEGDTYSHISHASRARKLCHDDEGAYDHVTRHNLQKGEDDDTYDVTSGLHGYDYRVQVTSKHSADEYSDIRRVQ